MMEMTVEKMLVLVRLGIFAVFLTTAAWQDFKTRQIPVWILYLSGAAAVAVQAGAVLVMAGIAASNGEDPGVFGIWKAWLPYLAGLLPGAVLLVFSWISHGIGTGDGCFFLISGLFLGLADNLLLLSGAVFGSGLFGLGYYVFHCVNRCRSLNDGSDGKAGIGKTEIPFLPFAVLPGIGIMINQLAQAGLSASR